MAKSPKFLFLGLSILALIAILVAAGIIQIPGNGAATKEEPPKRLFNEPHANAVEFGGMYGFASAPVNIPNTTSQSCPSGFLSHQILGTNGVDYPATFCYKPINNPSTWTPSVGSSEFGGMFGHINGVKVNNPQTGEHSCPNDFTKTIILGTSGVDYPLYYCNKPIDNIEDAELMKKWKPSPGAVQFGGMFGFVNSARKNNPISNEFSCPAGFYQTDVFGTNGVDYPAYYCSREW